MIYDYTVSVHAKERWDLRCNGFNLENEMYHVKKLNTVFSRHLRAIHFKNTGCLEEREYWVSEDNDIIFVALRNVVITVLRLNEVYGGIVDGGVYDNKSKNRYHIKNAVAGFHNKVKNYHHLKNSDKSQDKLSNHQLYNKFANEL